MSKRQVPLGRGLLYGLYQNRLRRSLVPGELPHHVAMIIDGNRRWAKRKLLGGIIALSRGLDMTVVAEGAERPAEVDVLGELGCDLVQGFVFSRPVASELVPQVAADIEREGVQLVRDKIGPVAAFKLAITVGRLPKTRSGKILRGTMKKIADGDQWSTPATIDDPAVLGEIGDALKERGVG